MKPIKILFIATSNNTIGETNIQTGVWLESLAAPYYIFKDAGIDISIASPYGGCIPFDPQSRSIIVATQKTKRFLQDKQAMDLVSSALILNTIKNEEFDAVFLPGGHGSLWDLTNNASLTHLLGSFIARYKPVALVCQGVASLLTLVNDSGQLWITGKRITGFSNSEERATGLMASIPFLLEDKLISAGSLYSKSVDYTSYVVIDGHVITGQNPASAEQAAKKMLSLLQTNKYSSPVYPQSSLNKSSSL